MNVFIDNKLAKTMAYSVCACFLLIHMVMIVLFHRFGVTPMFYFNFLSIAFYLLSFLIARREVWRTFAVSVYVEVCLHMSLAVFFTGWNNGFQVTLIGMSILMFYAEYVGRTMGVRFVHAAPVCLVGMTMYLISFVVGTLRPPAYPLPAEVSFWLEIAWAVIVFVITIIFLEIFVLLTFHSEELLSTLAAHDRLTGLPNRHYLSEYLSKVAQDEGLEGYWLAMADIDDFKQINDTYGHNCGDYVLKTLAEILREGCGDAQVCRWGGEEFLLVGRLGDGLEAQRERLERLRKTVEGYSFWYGKQRLKLTMTIGIAPFKEGASVNEWVNAADGKLYEGKSSGKNKVVA